MRGEAVERGLQVGAAVADVRSETEVADPRAAGVPDPRAARVTDPRAVHSGSSRQTSTETSSTASGIGGSGLAAFTQTASAPKSSMIRSATTVHRRSSVL